jgi:hypothetical protein
MYVCVYGAIWSSNSTCVLAPLSLSLSEATRTAWCIFLLSLSISLSLSPSLSLSLSLYEYIYRGGWLTFSAPSFNPHLNLITVILELNLRKRRTYIFRPLPTHFQALTYQQYSCLLTCVGVHLPRIHEHIHEHTQTHTHILTWQPYSCLLSCVGVHLPSIHELRRATRAMTSTQVYTYTYIHTHI